MSPAAARILLESNAAMEEYKARVLVRNEMARNDEVIALTNKTDSERETWMWGLFAVVLKRRYKFTAPKIAEILSDVQALHNELYEQAEDEEDAKRLIYEVVKDEVGLSIFDDDMGEG